MTERTCPVCGGEGVVEVEAEELEDDVDEETGEVISRFRHVIGEETCPTCGGEGVVDE